MKIAMYFILIFFLYFSPLIPMLNSYGEEIFKIVGEDVAVKLR